MIPNPYPGKFIAYECIDGGGKSTQCQKTYELLSSVRVDDGNILMVKEPAKYLPSGKLIYGLLFGRDNVKFSDMSPRQRQRHYQNRIQHYHQTIIPALEAGKTVLSDRCLASISLDVERPIDLDTLLEDEECYFRMSEVPFIRPDLIIIYDVPPEVGVARLNQKDERRRDFFEQPEKMVRHRQAYLEFAAKFSDFCTVIDGQGSVDEVFLKTIEAVKTIYSDKKS